MSQPGLAPPAVNSLISALFLKSAGALPQDPLGQFKLLHSVTASVQTNDFTVALLASMYLNTA